jgi:hypothetical protein
MKADKNQRFYRYGWKTGTAYTGETDAEWIARGGHLGTAKKWEGIDGHGNQGHISKTIHDWLNPHAYHMPEHDLWRAFWLITIQDALGLTYGATRPCIDCHLSYGCECFNNTTGVGQIAHDRKARCTWPVHTLQQCAIEFIEGDKATEYCAIMNIEVDELRRLYKKLLTTKQAGAKRKLTSYIRRSGT